MPERVHLGDHLDNAGAADAGDADAFFGGFIEPTVLLLLDADDAGARFQRRHGLLLRADGAGRGALAAGDLGALEGGPGGRGAGEQALACEPSTISALVPTSTASMMSSLRWGDSDSTTAAASAPTWPAMHGQHVELRAPALKPRSSSRAGRVRDRPVASANGAPPSSIGSMPSSRWCITGLPTSTMSTTSSRLSPASAVTSAASWLMASRTAAVISTSPPGFIMT